MTKDKSQTKLGRLIQRVMACWQYCSAGVWQDTRRTAGVRAVKIANLSVASFLDRGLQIRSMALTYSTVLAIVPALALMVAIGRGFGLQDMLQSELFVLFPSQRQVISTFLGFVDSYLSNASQGIFVGVGIIVLLWTIFSLLSGIEDAFNNIWDVGKGRTLFRKFTDYITICLMVPVLLICSAGISIFMSSAIQNIFNLPFLTPFANMLLELAPLALSWLAFALSYYLFPNTRVKFKYAAISGALASIGFYILQWLFVSGQIYVSKYNAIYGSFAFLPLLLIWLQMSWLILLSGCVLTYSMQNVFTFNFLGDASRISIETQIRMAIIVMTVVARRFIDGKKPLNATEIASGYDMPVRVIEHIIEKLKGAGLLMTIAITDDTFGIAPARDVSKLTTGDILHIYCNAGDSEISPDFNKIYAPMFRLFDESKKCAAGAFDKLRIADLPLPEMSGVPSQGK